MAARAPANALIERLLLLCWEKIFIRSLIFVIIVVVVVAVFVVVAIIIVDAVEYKSEKSLNFVENLTDSNLNTHKLGTINIEDLKFVERYQDTQHTRKVREAFSFTRKNNQHMGMSIHTLYIYISVPLQRDYIPLKYFTFASLRIAS